MICFSYQRCGYVLIFLMLVFILDFVSAQTPELATAQSKVGQLWGGVTAHGDAGTFDFRAGFFPNDHDILQYRGTTNDNYFGSGFQLGCTAWKAPFSFFNKDTIFPFAVYGARVSNATIPNSGFVNGQVDPSMPLQNYIRFRYPLQAVDMKAVTLTDFGVYDPSKLTGGTYDQLIQVKTKHILGVTVTRKIMTWSQSLNDNYIIVDTEFENVSSDTLKTFYIWTPMGMASNFYSLGISPQLPSNETPKYRHFWQHYYGGRVDDSLRIFYVYHADDPNESGDNMGSPSISQKGRLMNTNFVFNTFLHASKHPYLSAVNDTDDVQQPRITYVGNETKIPSPDPSEDEFGNRSFWAMRGGLSTRYPMSGNTHPGTFHMINTDEGLRDFGDFVAGEKTSNNQSRNMSTFGPYTFPPGYKIRIVYATGVAGIGLKASKEIGQKWLAGILTDPPGMPDVNTGWLPSNFVFPSGATEQDKRKDRWMSMGIDSMHRTAWRAKWNFKTGYKIPQAPPPPDSLSVIGTGRGVEIRWRNPLAETMTNFAGYRIMRRISAADSVFYDEVYSSDSTDKAISHLFIDSTVILAAQYYYYVQVKARISANDVNADPLSRGKIIYSSRLFVPNVTPTYPPGYSSDDMSQIRIAPNPYNINDPILKGYGYTDDRGINFFNLPGEVTIRIYTENGDLVQTINHKSVVGGGLYFWNMITSSQQVISSGIYIAVFQKPSGQISYQKFVVVR